MKKFIFAVLNIIYAIVMLAYAVTTVVFMFDASVSKTGIGILICILLTLASIALAFFWFYTKRIGSNMIFLALWVLSIVLLATQLIFAYIFSNSGADYYFVFLIPLVIALIFQVAIFKLYDVKSIKEFTNLLLTLAYVAGGTAAVIAILAKLNRFTFLTEIAIG